LELIYDSQLLKVVSHKNNKRNKGFFNHIFTHFNVILLFLYASYKIKVDILFLFGLLYYAYILRNNWDETNNGSISNNGFYFFGNEIEQTCRIYFNIAYWFVSTMKEYFYIMKIVFQLSAYDANESLRICILSWTRYFFNCGSQGGWI
jgi:hypothetical protein